MNGLKLVLVVLRPMFVSGAMVAAESPALRGQLAVLQR